MDTKRESRLLYLTVGANDEDWGIVVTTVGFQSITHGVAYPPVQHPNTHLFTPEKGRIINEYQLVYIVKGSGWFSSQSLKKKLKVVAGTMILLFPNEWHSYAPDNETGWDEYWVGFRGEHIDNRVRKGFFSREEPLHNIGLSTSIVGLYDDIIRIAEKEKTGYQQMISSIVLSILGSVYYKSKNIQYADSYIVDKIREARDIMKNPDYFNISQMEIARKIGMGYTWYRKKFKEYTGVTPARYQIQQKLMKAKELLTTTGNNVSEIAFSLRFESVRQFSTFFKHYEDITPSEFRHRTH
ncbi:MAG: AraC family transcriptional regulator [Tannerella sp.]|jgi:AraC-like DNA-binding protein|nr:AraC family transcriptional regulator [Tannerella sp.]